jgi:predicted nucleic acid-binding protein
MNTIACIYFEGNDSKVALFKKDNGITKFIRGTSIDTSLAFAEQKLGVQENKSEKSGSAADFEFLTDELTSYNRTYLQKLNEFLYGEDLSKCGFIPILKEPAIYFQKVTDQKDLANLNITQNGKIETIIDFVDLADNGRLAIYPSGKATYLTTIDSLARMNNRKFLRIEAVKSAEISFASFVIRNFDLRPEHTMLLLYVGKDYSKVIFIKGNKIHHIGSTLSVGKNSFNAHNVIVSKILLEMEQAGVNNVNKIAIAGEDNSKNLFSLIKESYPTTQIKFLKSSLIDEKKIDSSCIAPGYMIPLAVAKEYFDEIENKTKGINLLPSYVKEQQKNIQLGWSGFLLIGLIILSISFFAYNGYMNNVYANMMDNEIRRLTLIQQQNREDVEKIKGYERKIQNVDQTRMMLEKLSVGTGVISNQMEKLANFVKAKDSLWINNLAYDQLQNIKIAGYTLSRPLVRQLSDSYSLSTLQSIIFDPVKNMRSYKFSIDGGKIVKGSVENEPKK